MMMRSHENKEKNGAWRAMFLAMVLSAASLALLLPVRARAQQGSAGTPQVIELQINDEVEPILAEYIDDGIDQAAKTQASLILITMDTPGGLEDSMMDIIKHILDSPVPVAVYVSPSGSRGASAGFYILLSADVAAMAPGTHTGAASPVIEIDGTPVNTTDTMKSKLLNDSAAFLRSYAGKRGRNVTLAETAVTDAKAFTETEALDGKLIDLIAKSPADLLAQLDGRTITRFDGHTDKLSLANAQMVAVEMSARQRFLSRVVQPDAFFILLIVAVLGIYAEFTHPGMVAPGVIGGIAAVLALFAMHILPVNFAGLLLILLALALFILEAKFTSHGVLAVGGIVSMLLGALMLIRSPLTGGGVSFVVAVAVTLPFAVIIIFLMRLVLKSRRWKGATGREQLVGTEAEVTEALATSDAKAGFSGMVRMHGELWRAVAEHAIEAGTRVRVTRVEGLTVHVRPPA
jgi:membrane-bound serine protease (ClpP class)